MREVGFVVACVLVLAALGCSEEAGETCTPMPIDECRVAPMYATCAGGSAAQLYCAEPGDDDHFGCKWFSGCRAVEYPLARECVEENCTLFHASWGKEPWAASRGMVLTLEVDPSLRAALEMAPSALQCEGEIPARTAVGCAQGIDLQRSPIARTTDILELWGGVRSRDEDASLVLHIDPVEQGGRARACWVHASDAFPLLSEPICATAGTVRLDREIAEVGDAAAVRVSLELEFGEAGSAEAFVVRGVL